MKTLGSLGFSSHNKQSAVGRKIVSVACLQKIRILNFNGDGVLLNHFIYGGVFSGNLQLAHP